MVSMVRAHGWDRQLPTEDRDALRMRHKVPSAFYQQYTFYDLGYNLRPTEIQGFIGGTQMEFIDEIVASRARNFGVLAPEVYGDHSAYVPLRYDHIDLVSSFAIPLVCGSVEERDRLITRCDGRVEVRPIVGGSIVEQPFYQKHVSRSRPTPNAALIHRQGLYFANNPELSDLDLEELLDVFTGG
jgi:CDP-6-deoxy-D-xylo-4-hexulose-3-dehydrase